MNENKRIQTVTDILQTPTETIRKWAKQALEKTATHLLTPFLFPESEGLVFPNKERLVISDGRLDDLSSREHSPRQGNRGVLLVIRITKSGERLIGNRRENDRNK